MNTYIGVKQIKALQMTRQQYSDYRGWELPADEEGSDEGFLVEYIDGGKANHPDHVGYISWSPEDVFNHAYRPTCGMSFGLAIEAAKLGRKIARDNWNGKGMFVVYMPPLYLPSYNTQEPGPRVNDRTARHIGENMPLDSQGYFAMFCADKTWQPGWLASQRDMLSDDWQIVQ